MCCPAFAILSLSLMHKHRLWLWLIAGVTCGCSAPLRSASLLSSLILNITLRRKKDAAEHIEHFACLHLMYMARGECLIMTSILLNHSSLGSLYSNTHWSHRCDGCDIDVPGLWSSAHTRQQHSLSISAETAENGAKWLVAHKYCTSAGGDAAESRGMTKREQGKVREQENNGGALLPNHQRHPG